MKNKNINLQVPPEFFREIVDNLSFCLITLAPVFDKLKNIIDFEITYINREGIRFFYKTEELNKKKLSDLFPVNSESLIDKCMVVLSGKAAEKFLFTDENSGQFLEISISKLNDMINFTWEIKTQNLTEQRYRNTLDSIKEGCAIIGFNWKYIYVNEANANHAHLKPEEMIGKSMFSLIPGVEKSVFFSIYKKCMEERISCQVEAKFDFADGSEAWYEAIAHPVPEGIFVISMDISGRKKTEEALRKSEEHYHSLFNAIDEGFCVIKMLYDKEGNPVDYCFLEVNPAFEKQSGIIDGQGRRILEFAPEMEKHWFKIYGDVARTGVPVRFKSYAHQLNRWLDVYAFRIAGSEENNVAVLFKDITEHKFAEEELKESKEKFAKAFIANPNALVISRLEDGKIIEVNDSFLNLFGYTHEQVIGRTSLELNMFASSGDRDKAISILKKENGLRNYEIRIRRNKGEERIALLSIEIINISGIRSMLTILEDITERKLAEEALKESRAKLLEAQELARFGNYTLDIKDSNRIEWSDQLYEIWEVDKNKPFPPFEQLWNLIHPDDRESVHNAVTGTIKQSKRIETEFRILFPDNRIKYIHLISTGVFDEDGNLIKRQGVEVDITERKVAQIKLQEAYKQIELRLKEKEVLMRELYHRTKNNLQIISSLLGIKASGFSDDETKTIFEEMQNRIRGIALVQDRLYESRNLSRINLKIYIIDLLELLSRNFLHKKIELLYELEEIEVLIDVASPCGLIITELVLNSLKHAFPGEKGGQIKIKLQKLSEGRIQLIISDNGIGLIDDSFEEYGRLGIPLFKDIAENQLDAKIELTNDEGVKWKIEFSHNLYEERV